MSVLWPVQIVYNATIRRLLPRKITVLNGVATRRARLFDATDIHDDYEAACINSIRKNVQAGDDVVVVGGGYGVSAIAAVRAAADVDVTVFEAAAERVESTEEACALNNGGEAVTVEHAIVAEAVDAWGATDGAEIIAPEELPDADVMEIDAEGAELSILKGLGQRPRVLVVESHGHLDSPTDAVRARMQMMGYEIESIEPELAEKDVMVLTAVRE